VLRFLLAAGSSGSFLGGWQPCQATRELWRAATRPIVHLSGTKTRLYMELGPPHFTMRGEFLKNAATRHGCALAGAIAGIRRVGVDAALDDGAAARLHGGALIGLRHCGATAVTAAAHRTRVALHDARRIGRLALLRVLLLAVLELLLLHLLGGAGRGAGALRLRRPRATGLYRSLAGLTLRRRTLRLRPVPGLMFVVRLGRLRAVGFGGGFL